MVKSCDGPAWKSEASVVAFIGEQVETFSPPFFFSVCLFSFRILPMFRDSFDVMCETSVKEERKFM
jgi:hypothetical protein